MVFTPEVIGILLLNSLFLLFGGVALFFAIKIATGWNIEATSQKQYSLEKQSFLTATIIKFIFFIKIPLFLFFIFTLEEISHLLTGAMCAAGVVDATPYGMNLLIVKTINIYLFGFWLILHSQDMKKETLPFTKLKFSLFIPLFILLVIEISIETLMFMEIDIDKMVSCCGNIFSASERSGASMILAIDTKIILGLYFGNFALILLTYLFKLRKLFAIFNALFIISALISLIIFFSPYIYELPTHNCPFCILKKDYNYVGFFLYSFLFLGTFLGALSLLLNNRKVQTLSLIFTSLYLSFNLYYLLSFFIENRVFL